MLQIRNADDGKPEWNVSETHLIIPMIEGDLISHKESDKILTSAVTLNSLEGGDQAILTNALEHSLVVGLDKNLFESTNYKSDLLIIQNSDLKLLQCNTDIKVAHELSDVEQDKSEILWQNPTSKDRICASEKAIFEVRHVLNYDELDLEKTNGHINLGNLSNGMSPQVMKTDKEFLMGENISHEKNITDSQFIVSFNPEAGTNKSICISLNAEMIKAVDNLKSVENKKSFQNKVQSDLNDVAPSYKLEEDFEENVIDTTGHMVPYGDQLPVSIVECSKTKTDGNDNFLTKKNQLFKDFKLDGGKLGDGMTDSFQEKNLPLKKKAKMKRTIVAVNSENQRSLLKEDVVAAEEHVKFANRRKITLMTTNLQEEQDLVNNDSESLVNKMKKQKKVKLKSLHKNSLIKEVKEVLKMSESSAYDEVQTTKIESSEFIGTKFNDIYELVECLRKCRMINTAVWQTLNSGLKEMKVDILKEMTEKRKENCAPESSNYSPQLKAFALVLYFKQPAAFNHLSQLYRNGWPSLKVIKEWKRRMNTLHRRNFVRLQSEPKSLNKP